MRGLFGRPVFSVGGLQYYWEDVVLAGIFAGNWPPLARLVREELACARDPRAPSPAKGDVDAAAAEFRYARDLVSAADMHAWLQRWALTVEEWMAYIRRSLAHERAAPDEGARCAERLAPSPDEVAAALPATFACSGTAARLAERLASWAAVAARLDDDAGEELAAADPLADVAGAADVGDALLVSGLATLPRDRLRERAALVGRAAAARDRFRERVLTPATLRAELDGRRLDWIHVEYRSASFPSESVAREAALCVRADGLDLGAVVAETGAAAMIASRATFLADVPSPLRQCLLGARTGEVVGPVADGERFVVHQLDAKRLPTLDDPAVRRRAEESAIARALAGAASDRVTWQFAL